jgi:L-2,4-diaminobutyrate decarboxylase
MYKVLTQIDIAPNCVAQFQKLLATYLTDGSDHSEIYAIEAFHNPNTSDQFTLCETFLDADGAQKYRESSAFLDWQAAITPLTAQTSECVQVTHGDRSRETDQQKNSFLPNQSELLSAVRTMITPPPVQPLSKLPVTLPEHGIGDSAALSTLAGIVLGNAIQLGHQTALAHMDPPTPWVTWATTLWNASLNQNLLHPDTGPTARDIETRVIDWLAPLYGMDGGHMVPGSTLANLTAIWAAREITGATCVVASEHAHLSIAKAAHILGMQFISVPTQSDGRIDVTAFPDIVEDSVLVLTAGATSTGAIDDLLEMDRAKWCHVDAAWAGPLMLSNLHKGLLKGIENADSIAVSAHKWFFQPKESALVLFRDTPPAQAALTFGSAYLAAPNIGVLGSHGAVAVPLLATLLAWGQEGMADQIEAAMAKVADLFERLEADTRVHCYGPPATGVLLWRPLLKDFDMVRQELPKGLASVTMVEDQNWFRQVAANPLAQISSIWNAIDKALET